jgi:hypothetical protein
LANKIFLWLAVGTLGIGVGGGAAYGTAMILGPAPAEAKAARSETAFVPSGKILAPLVFPDGRLSGYVSFEVALEVQADRSEEIAERLPLLLNAINMRTYRTPMASGPDGMLPNLKVLRKVVADSATEAFGAGTVMRTAVTQAVPA